MALGAGGVGCRMERASEAAQWTTSDSRAQSTKVVIQSKKDMMPGWWGASSYFAEGGMDRRTGNGLEHRPDLRHGRGRLPGRRARARGPARDHRVDVGAALERARDGRARALSRSRSADRIDRPPPAQHRGGGGGV